MSLTGRFDTRLSPEQEKAFDLLALGAGLPKTEVFRRVLCDPDNGDSVLDLIHRRAKERLEKLNGEEARH